MVETDLLLSSVQTKRLLNSRNNNIILFTLNQVVTGIDELGDTDVKIVDLIPLHLQLMTWSEYLFCAEGKLNM